MIQPGFAVGERPVGHPCRASAPAGSRRRAARNLRCADDGDEADRPAISRHERGPSPSVIRSSSACPGPWPSHRQRSSRSRLRGRTTAASRGARPKSANGRSRARADAGLGQHQLDLARQPLVARDLGRRSSAPARSRSASGRSAHDRSSSSRRSRSRARVGQLERAVRTHRAATMDVRVDQRRQHGRASTADRATAEARAAVEFGRKPVATTSSSAVT